MALAGTITGIDQADQLLAKFATISAQSGIRYWSVSDKAWHDLVLKASALEAPDPRQTRGEFTLPELKTMQRVYFAEEDNRFFQRRALFTRCICKK